MNVKHRGSFAAIWLCRILPKNFWIYPRAKFAISAGDGIQSGRGLPGVRVPTLVGLLSEKRPTKVGTLTLVRILDILDGRASRRLQRILLATARRHRRRSAIGVCSDVCLRRRFSW